MVVRVLNHDLYQNYCFKCCDVPKNHLYQKVTKTLRRKFRLILFKVLKQIRNMKRSRSYFLKKKDEDIGCQLDYNYLCTRATPHIFLCVKNDF